jgi:hypothetical protein
MNTPAPAKPSTTAVGAIFWLAYIVLTVVALVAAARFAL